MNQNDLKTFFTVKAKYQFSHCESIEDIEAQMIQYTLLLFIRSRIELMDGNPYIETVSSNLTSDIVSLSFTQYASIWSLYFTELRCVSLFFDIISVNSQNFLLSISLKGNPILFKRCWNRFDIGRLWWTVMSCFFVGFFL